MTTTPFLVPGAAGGIAGLGVAPKPAGMDVQIDLARKLEAAPA